MLERKKDATDIYIYAKIGKQRTLTPASAAIGFPRRLNSDSSSAIVLLIRDWMPGILDLITVSKC